MPKIVDLSKPKIHYAIRFNNTGEFVVVSGSYGSLFRLDENKATIYNIRSYAQAKIEHASNALDLPANKFEVVEIILSTQCNQKFTPPTQVIKDLGRVEKIRKELYRLVAEQLDVKLSHINDDSDIFDDLAGDSLDAIEVIMLIEDEFKINIDDDAADKLVRKSMKEIVDYLADRSDLTLPE